jgi:hypothetical protein
MITEPNAPATVGSQGVDSGPNRFGEAIEAGLVTSQHCSFQLSSCDGLERRWAVMTLQYTQDRPICHG